MGGLEGPKKKNSLKGGKVSGPLGDGYFMKESIFPKFG